MTQTEYQEELQAVLADHSADATRRIQQLLSRIPAQTRSLVFEVFPTQDADGCFDVRATLAGPDLYVLNQAIADRADIFEVSFTDTGVEPVVPLVDPEDVDFDVNDTIVDVVAMWLRAIWATVDSSSLRIPVRVEGHDGYGQ